MLRLKGVRSVTALKTTRVWPERENCYLHDTRRRQMFSVNTCKHVYIYIYIYIYMCEYIYIYIYWFNNACSLHSAYSSIGCALRECMYVYANRAYINYY